MADDYYVTSRENKISNANSRNSKLRAARDALQSIYDGLQDDKDDFKTMYKKIDDLGDQVALWKGGLRKEFDTAVDALYEDAKDDHKNVLDDFHDDLNSRISDIKKEIDKNNNNIFAWRHEIAEWWENLTNG